LATADRDDGGSQVGSAVAAAVTVDKALADNNRNCGGRQQ
jgi:hypothetical protein